MVIGAAERLAEVQHAIFNAWQEHSKAGWDGKNAKPITLAAVSNTLGIMSCLPLNMIQLPEVGASIRGGVTLDWETTKGGTLTMIVKDDSLVYAGIHANGDEKYGTIRLQNRKELLGIVLDVLQMAKDK